MIISIDRQYATFLDEEGVEIKLEHTVGRNEFLTEFSVPGADEIMSIAFETDRNLYHVCDANYNVINVGGPSGHPAIEYIEANKESIKAWFQQKYDEV